MRLLVLILLLCASVPATAQTVDATRAIDVPHQQDQGFRLHAAIGYPAITALGIGWKTRGGTEVLAQAGGQALWAFIVGTTELSVSHDYFRRPWGALHAGLAGSLLFTHAFVIDCYGDEVCEDVVQNLYLASPRAGVRLRLDRRKRFGVLPFLDLSAGPQIGLCRGDCPGGDLVINAAVSLRGVLDFRRRPR